jgi:hypothetical protein
LSNKPIRRLRLLISLSFAVALLLSSLATSQAHASWRGWGETKAQCISVEAGGYDLVYAHVSSSMWVSNHGAGGEWVTNFRLKARLVPTTSGLNWSRSWKTHRFPVHSDLFQDHYYNSPMVVNTDTVDPEADWKVQVKQVWDRRAPWSDLVHEFFITFDTGHCRKGKIPKGGGGPIVFG